MRECHYILASARIMPHSFRLIPDMTAFSFNPNDYQQLLDEKQQYLTELLAPFSPPPLECFPSPAEHYRMRAEFRIWHEGNTCNYVMYDKDKTKHIIHEFPVASAAINHAMRVLMETVNQNNILKRKLFQVEFLSTLTNELLITLVYHRPLDETWITEAKSLEKALDAHILGRSRKQKIILSQDFIDETLNVDGKPYHYRQPEGAFTQPNAQVNQKMLAWAKTQAAKCKNDLLELYCGIGNFTMVLANTFNKVLATEMNKRAVAAAQHNLQTNNIDNIAFARLSSEEITQAMRGDRIFKRLKDANINLEDYQFDTIFVDPPRAGLDEETLALTQQFKHIIYISCNPQTLAENLTVLGATHQIKAAALFDQFPYTHHCEAGVFLEKRSTD